MTLRKFGRRGQRASAIWYGADQRFLLFRRAGGGWQIRAVAYAPTPEDYAAAKGFLAALGLDCVSFSTRRQAESALNLALAGREE